MASLKPEANRLPPPGGNASELLHIEMEPFPGCVTLISHDLSGGAKEPAVLNPLDELEPGTDREPALRYAMRRLLVPLVVFLHKQQRGWPLNVSATYARTTASRGVI